MIRSRHPAGLLLTGMLLLAPTLAATSRTATAFAAAASYDGTFRGDGIVLRLSGDGAGQRYVGSITEAALSTPVELRRSGTSLRGTWIAAATARPMTATLQGNTLTLVRGTSRRTLTRAADDRAVSGESLDTSVLQGAVAAPLFGRGFDLAGGITLPGAPKVPAADADQPADQPLGDPADEPAAPTALPAFLRPGMRLIYQLGSGSSAPVGSDHGPTGAQSYQQVNITAIDAKGNVTIEVRSLLVDLTAQAVYDSKTDGGIVSVDAGGEYWMSPAKLAGLKSGGGVTVQKLTYPLDGKNYRAVRITTTATSSTTQYTYDLDTGLLLIWGMDSTGADGSHHQAQNRFVSARQVTTPWTDQQAGRAVLGLTKATWSGTYTTVVDGAYSATYQLAQRWEVTRSDALAVQTKETTTLDMGNGTTPQTTTATHVYPVFRVWIDPAILAGLRKGQVIDDDRVLGLKTTVFGAQQGLLILVEKGAIQSTAWGYDLRTGLLTAVQLQQRHAPGTTTVYLQRTA